MLENTIFSKILANIKMLVLVIMTIYEDNDVVADYNDGLLPTVTNVLNVL